MKKQILCSMLFVALNNNADVNLAQGIFNANSNSKQLGSSNYHLLQAAAVIVACIGVGFAAKAMKRAWINYSLEKACAVTTILTSTVKNSDDMYKVVVEIKSKVNELLHQHEHFVRNSERQLFKEACIAQAKSCNYCLWALKNCKKLDAPQSVVKLQFGAEQQGVQQCENGSCKI